MITLIIAITITLILLICLVIATIIIFRGCRNSITPYEPRKLKQEKLPRVIYINLDRSPDRKKKFETQANKIGLVYERFSGIDGSTYKLSPYEKHLFRNATDSMNKNIKLLGEKYKGVIGCALSHYYLWKKMIKNGFKNLIISEDDTKILPSIFSINLSGLPDNSVCFLTHRKIFNKNDKASFYKLSQNPEHKPFIWYGQGAILYFITNTAAHLLCEKIEKEGFTCEVDSEIIHANKNVLKFLSNPSHGIHEGEISVIESVNNL